MGKQIKYYGFRITNDGFWELHSVSSDGSEDVVKESFDKEYIQSECERLNRIVDDRNRKDGKYDFEAGLV